MAKRTYWLHKRTFFNLPTKEQDLKRGTSDANDDSFVIDTRDGDQSLLEADNDGSEGQPGSDHDLAATSQSVSQNSKQVSS